MRIYLIDLKRVRRTAALILVAALIVTVGTVLLLQLDGYVSASSEARGDGEIRTVIIDPGHGGEDCGAVGVDGVLEKDLNLAISLVMKEQLEAKGYTVVMTRTEDRMLYSEEENIKGMRKISDLKNRCKIAGEYENAVFVSVHMNSFGAERYSGLQVYYADSNSESRALAEAVQTRVRADVQAQNERVIKNGKDLYILDNCPVTPIIVECGFLSNAAECKKLSEKEYQNRLSLAIVCGIIEYIEAK